MPSSVENLNRVCMRSKRHPAQRENRKEVKNMRIVTALCIGTLVLMSVASPAPAFNPQPEPPARANQLGAVVNNLVEVRIRLNVALAHPPEPGMVGVEGQYDAMAIQLGVLYNRVNSVLHPPEPGHAPPDDGRVLNALRTVRDQALGIVSDIIRNNHPPDDQRVFDSLNRVLNGAQAIVDLADRFIGDGSTIIGGE